MTRSNILIKVEYGQSIKLQINSGGYPETVIPSIYDLVMGSYSENSYFESGSGFYENVDSTELSNFINELGLTIGYVGNFSYFYEIDFVNKTVSVWESTTYWVNAPENWKEKDYNCWMGRNGRYGYTNWKKGKKIQKLTFQDIKDDKKQFSVSE